MINDYAHLTPCRPAQLLGFPTPMRNTTTTTTRKKKDEQYITTKNQSQAGEPQLSVVVVWWCLAVAWPGRTYSHENVIKTCVCPDFM